MKLNMNKRILLAISFVMCVLFVNAQYKAVQYQYERNWFNENNPLPAETVWMLNGNIPDGVTCVEVDVYSSSIVDKKKQEFTGEWRKGLVSTPTQFSIPVNYKLNGNDNYSLEIRYYATADENQKQEVFNSLKQAVANYLRMNLAVDGKRIAFLKKPTVMYEELNYLIVDGLSLFRLGNNLKIKSLSSVVLDKLNQLKMINLNDAVENIQPQGQTEDELKMTYFYQQFDDLINICNVEINQYMQSEIVYLVDTKQIFNYPTEKTENGLYLNLGYAGVYKSGKFDNINYASVPYAGISIPLANVSMDKNFWSRSAISIGVFLKKLDFRYVNHKIGGPIIDLPVYVAYGYKPVSFMRINLGVTALQEANNVGKNFDNVYIRPFIGVAFELNVLAKFK